MAKNAEIIRAGPRQQKKLELFYALKTLSTNDVEVEKRPSRPA